MLSFGQEQRSIVFLYSASCQRCPSGPNSFIRYLSNGQDQIGQVQFFMVGVMLDETFAHVLLYLEVECHELPRRFYRKVIKTEKEEMTGIAHIQKFFHVQIGSDEYMLELVHCFDHN